MRAGSLHRGPWIDLWTHKLRMFSLLDRDRKGCEIEYNEECGLGLQGKAVGECVRGPFSQDARVAAWAGGVNGVNGRTE